MRRDPSVEAVVLFGSRARGTAHARSDWDVAVIERNETTDDAACRLFDDLPGVRPLRFGADEIERHKDTAGALEAALVRQGVALAGDWDPPECRDEGLTIDIVRLRANLENATDEIRSAVVAGISHLYATDRRQSDWTRITTASVAAAEHMAKAILTGFGLTPREVHFVDALAEQLRKAYRGRDDARQTYWADRIQAMNGTTRTQRLHDAGCRRFVAPPPEPLKRSIERTAQAQRLQVLWLREMCEQRPELAEEIAGTAREIARTDGVLSGIRAGYASEPLTADEPTCKTIARLEEATTDWIANAKRLLSRLEGREASAFKIVGDEPPWWDVSADEWCSYTDSVP